MKFTNADTISAIENPLDWSDEKNRVFLAACREMAEFHQTRSSDIRELYKRRGFSPESLQSLDDLAALPSLGVAAMKHFLFLSREAELATLKLTSSGTRGQKTQIWFDAESLERVQNMLTGLWRQLGMISDQPTNYLMMIYDPKDAQDLGIAFSIRNQQRFAPPKRSFFALQKNSAGQWQFMFAEALKVLHEYIDEGLPVRISGIPSFMFDLLCAIKEPLRLPEGSAVLTGGGWKAAEEKRIAKEKFHDDFLRLLGIAPNRIRDGYGMAEHSAPYMECAQHKFHVPVYNRILVRDPETMRALEPGGIGLLELITPFNTMMPNLSVLSTDLGHLDPEACPCGHKSPTFTLVGRGGLVKHKGCAMTAADLTKGGK